MALFATLETLNRAFAAGRLRGLDACAFADLGQDVDRILADLAAAPDVGAAERVWRARALPLEARAGALARRLQFLDL